ncbi:MAG: sulfite exporter TauE/SafE family protein [Pseudomonadota bacterium]
MIGAEIGDTSLLVLGVTLIVIGGFAGIIGGMFGIGGGVVIVPTLFALFGALGAPDAVRMHVAIGTSLATILVTSLRSVIAHAERGAVDFQLLRQWAPLIALGAVVGAALARVISGEALTLIFAMGAMGVAVKMALSPNQDMSGGAAEKHIPPVVRAPLSFGIGAVSALMGIGGGIMGVMVLTMAGRTIRKAVATAAGFGVAIAVPGALGFIVAGWGAEGLPWGSLGYVNLIAFAIISVMTFLTAPTGVKIAHSVSMGLLSRSFAIYLALTSLLLFRKIFGF